MRHIRVDTITLAHNTLDKFVKQGADGGATNTVISNQLQFHGTKHNQVILINIFRINSVIKKNNFTYTNKSI